MAMAYNKNTISTNRNALIMYVDMNSYFASCEQQMVSEYRNRPIGVCPFSGPRAVIIAPSIEAKKFGVKTGMRFSDAKALCPELIMAQARPVIYRRFHVQIMNLLREYCEEVIPKSIDEAVVNLTNYKLVYKDPIALAQQIKEQMANEIGKFVTCSIGIAPNVFLAKLATELQKPNGLVVINEDNIDEQLAKLSLTDLPGIAIRNALRLNTIGIHSPLELRHASESKLRKAFGGIVGTYWHQRLHFGEVDMYTSNYKAMSATRMLSKEIRNNVKAQQSLLIALCTKLEQRMVKQGVFCREIIFKTTYYDGTASWKVRIKVNDALQDGMELMEYIMNKVRTAYYQERKAIFNTKMRSIGVIISAFLPDTHLQYSLFDNRIQKDIVRKAMYQIKDKYGKNSVRKASEIVQVGTMKDAIGFGSVKDLYQSKESQGPLDDHFNGYLLEEDKEQL